VYSLLNFQQINNANALNGQAQMRKSASFTDSIKVLQKNCAQ